MVDIAKGVNVEELTEQLEETRAEHMTEMSEEEKQDWFDLIMKHGYTASEAEGLVNVKSVYYADINEIKRATNISRTIPVEALPNWSSMTKEALKRALWEMGINTKHSKHAIDVICHRIFGHAQCGLVFYGPERLDKGWTNLVIDGRNVASEEARFNKDPEVLQVLYGNKKG